MSNYRSVISADQLAARLDDDDLVVFDARFDLSKPDLGRAKWRAARIPGAVYADLDRDLAARVTRDTGRHPLPDPQGFQSWVRACGVGPADQVVVYDDAGGAIAARAWWLFRWLGHERVAVLDGGFPAWTDSGLAVEKGNAPSRARDMPAVGDPKVQSDWVLTTDELAADPGAARQARLVDARAAERYRGEFEPIDPVAGHVPGATNLPFTEVLDESGLFLSAKGVRSRLERHLGGDPLAPWSVMCGSGVTACHLAVAAEYAGLTAPRVYVGSFSEWIRDPGRPVATGAGSGSWRSADRS